MRGVRTARAAAIVAVGAALMVPAAATADPAATKSGALVNYVGGFKLKIAKKIRILIVCSANCAVNTTTVFKGPGLKQSVDVSGSLAAGATGGPIFPISGPAQKAMKAEPGKFKVQSAITATNSVTGAVETIRRTFRLKR